MSSCEKCWSDSRESDNYTELVRSRNCTPEEQAGEDANRCGGCKRMALHQYTHECMNKDCRYFGDKSAPVCERMFDEEMLK